MNKSLGEVFRSAWDTVMHNFKAIFVGILLYGIPSAVIGAVTPLMQTTRMLGAASFLQILLLLYMIFVSPLYMGYLTSVLRTYRMTGMAARMDTAWAAAKANYGRYLLTMLASIVISFAVVFVIMIIFVFVIMGSMLSNASNFFGMHANGTVGDLMISMIPGFVVMFVLVFLFILMLSFVQFIPGMEFPSGFKAVFASFRYVFRGNFWKTLGHVLVIGLISAGIQLAVMLPFYIPYFNVLMGLGPMMDYQMLADLINTQMSWMPLCTLISMVVGWFVQAFSTPYMFEVYLNAKTVSDGKDSQQMQPVYYDPYAGYAQNPQQPQGGNVPPQIPPDDRR